MITRIWHGRTRSIHADAYLKYIMETGIRDYKSIPEICPLKYYAGSRVVYATSGL
jgi:hypothetical protein